MSEHAEDPVGQASTKVVQYVSLATMAAEAIAQLSQQRAAAAAARDERTAAALRAQHTGARNTARLQWQPVLDPRRRASLGLADTGLAWAASQAWRPVDPEAALASARAEDRLRQLRPDVMSRFDRLTGEGLDPVEAMRRVAPFFDRPPAREGESVRRAALPPTTASPTAHSVLLSEASSAARDADNARSQHAARTAVLDDPATSRVDERREASDHARPHLSEATGQDRRAAALQAAAELTPMGARTAPQVAQDGYPERFTGEVLAAGRVKPKSPERTAPAAVRSTSIATAARAARTGR